MRELRLERRHCTACDGSGRLPSIWGGMRPCSRCDLAGFSAWSRRSFEDDAAKQERAE